MKFRHFFLILLLLGCLAAALLHLVKINPDERDAYLAKIKPSVKIMPLLSAGGRSMNGYRMAGIPNGLGAIDNNDQTFTLFLQHELDESAGAYRLHGANGAFISKWVITKPGHSLGSWQVYSGEDAIKETFLWNSSTVQYESTTTSFGKLCSADLPPVNAFYFAQGGLEGLGTKDRIMLSGEKYDTFKYGRFGRAFAHVVTGKNAGHTFELPLMGDMAFENLVASPYPQEKTIVAALDDAAAKNVDDLGEVYFYIGYKQSSGSTLDRAGLNNGQLFGLAVYKLPVEDGKNGLGPDAKQTQFSLAALPNLAKDDGTQLYEITKLENLPGITKFLRPEDGAWDPVVPSRFYFVTTGLSSEDENLIKYNGPGRLWGLEFDDITNPLKGGTIKLLLDHYDGIVNPGSITVTTDGKIYIEEDPGDNQRLAMIWEYDIAAKQLSRVAQANPKYFIPRSRAFLSANEEASGIIDLEPVTGHKVLLTTVQSHVNFQDWTGTFNRWRFGYNRLRGRELVEDGQLLLIFR